MQTENGKIVAVYHSKEDQPSAVNFKKSIAAAFQANFRQTETEEEVDPQSIHTAHYRFINSMYIWLFIAIATPITSYSTIDLNI